MKNIIREICFGKNSKFTLLLVFGLVIFVGLACKIGDRDTTDNDTKTEKIITDTTKDKPTSGDESAKSDRSNGDAPSDSETQALIKETMSDFADAVEEGDFSGFRSTTSKDFQVTYTTSQLNNTFKVFIDKKSQVLPSLRDVQNSTANFTEGPRIRTEKGYKILVANGQFSSDPYPVKFETEYELENGDWKILKIRVQM